MVTGNINNLEVCGHEFMQSHSASEVQEDSRKRVEFNQGWV